MADGGGKGDSGRGERVGGRDKDVEVPETGWGVVSGEIGDKSVSSGLEEEVIPS